jgi:dihydrofolate synthase/folylpolyglutamate synthase
VNLQQRLEDLYGLERRRDKLGLEGTRALLGALGDPQGEWASVHVAGTNGKGSVCALVERVLREAGIRTGLFTSPHLVDFRERIRVDGQWADADRLARRLDLIARLSEGKDRTFFEVCTALAFDDFAAREVEWAVVEVGMGGRLDATNVIEPSLSVVTSVGLDHTETLGTTLAHVAAEKAGIVKPDVPVVVGAMAGQAAAVIGRAAAHHEAPLVRADERVALAWLGDGPDGLRCTAEAPPWGRLELTCPLHGRHQLTNAGTALAALSVLAESGVMIEAEAVIEGFARARWPGRLEACPGEPRLWWDGAHNPDGFGALVDAWRQDLGFDPPEVVVLALARDKQVEAIAGLLAPWIPSARVVATQSRNRRAMPVDELHSRLAAAGIRSRKSKDVARSLETALAGPAPRSGARRPRREREAGRVLLCGSLMSVAEAMDSFGGAPGEWL